MVACRDFVASYPTQWQGFSWAFGNAWRDVICETEKRNRDIGSTANLDEMLSSEQLQMIKSRLNIVEDYVPEWDRKKEK